MNKISRVFKIVTIALLFGVSHVKSMEETSTPSTSTIEEYFGIDYALVCALEGNDIEKVTGLLQRGANPNAILEVCPNFFYARTTEMAKLLLKHGAELKTVNTQQANVLWYLFEDYGLSSEIQSRLQCSPGIDEKEVVLNIAKNRSKLVEFYLENEVSPRQSFYEECLLHRLAHSVWVDNTARIKLLDALPDLINEYNKNNETPLDVAEDYKTVLAFMDHMWDDIEISDLPKHNDDSNLQDQESDESDEEFENKVTDEEIRDKFQKASEEYRKTILRAFTDRGAVPGTKKKKKDECIIC